MKDKKKSIWRIGALSFAFLTTFFASKENVSTALFAVPAEESSDTFTTHQERNDEVGPEFLIDCSGF